MNAEQLLTHFDRIADAPDAIPRLRRFILDLAVRGKLVEQDPNDEPAADIAEADCGGEDAADERQGGFGRSGLNRRSARLSHTTCRAGGNGCLLDSYITWFGVSLTRNPMSLIPLCPVMWLSFVPTTLALT